MKFHSILDYTLRVMVTRRETAWDTTSAGTIIVLMSLPLMPQEIGMDVMLQLKI